jgi:hypothetical protein
LESLEDAALSAIASGEDAEEVVVNETLSQKLAQLKTLHTGIPADIDARSFEGMEADMEEYRSLIPAVKEMAESELEAYEKALSSKNDVESMLTVLETKDLDPASLSTHDDIVVEVEALNDEFAKVPLSQEDLADFDSQYSLIFRKTTELLQSEKEEPASRVLLMFRSLSRQMNSQIADTAEDSSAFSSTEVYDNPTVAFGLFSGSMFLSLFSLVLLMLLYILVSSKSKIPGVRQVVGALFVCSLIVLLSVSVLTFIFLNDTSSDATFNEYIADFATKTDSAVVIDSREAPYMDSQAMNLCGEKLAGYLEADGKSWTVYSLISEDQCIVSSESGNTTYTAEECLAQIDQHESSILVGYSQIRQPMHFSIIYKNMAQIQADASYYQSCPFAALFSSGSYENQS